MPDHEKKEISEIEKEALKFLERDFNQCFTQMRYYDSQVLDILKFLFTGYIALVGFSLGLFQFGVKEHIDLALPGIIALSIGILLGLFMFVMVVRNRVYFVQMARYVNEQRKFFFEFKPLNFENKSRMYTNYRFPQYFNWRSSQSLVFYIIAFLNSLLLGFLVFINYGVITGNNAWCIFGGPAMLFFIQLMLAGCYLSKRDGKSAEKATFGKE